MAEDGWRLVSFDYSQVELRILAHCSGEPALAEAFRRGEDVHRATAAEVFGMEPADVDRETRDRAKAVNFGIVYGISDFGLSEQLNIPRADARAYIDTYLARYPRVRSFIDTTIATAAQDGLRHHAARPAPPHPRAGGPHRAAAPARRAAGREHGHPGLARPTSSRWRWCARTRRSPRPGLRARLILQIHDELLLEAPEDEVERAVGARARGDGRRPTPSTRRSPSTSGVGETWLDAKSDGPAASDGAGGPGGRFDGRPRGGRSKVVAAPGTSGLAGGGRDGARRYLS